MAPKRRRAAILELTQGLTPEQVLSAFYDWRQWARPAQLPPPGAWRCWLILAGRGFGKTRTGAEWVKDQVENNGKRYIALVGETVSDCRKVMIEGESGLLACYPPGRAPKYEPSKRQVTWPNGAIATTYSGEEPDQLRGPQHDAAWADEAAKWKYAQDTWDNLEFGLRLGDDPRVVCTTTPRPIKLIRDLLKDPLTVVTRGSTYENAANLAPSTLARFRQKYEGTRLGRQELYADVLDDMPDALWRRGRIDELRVNECPPLLQIFVALDPAVTANEESDETGLIVAGVDERFHGYVLADGSGRFKSDVWARSAVSLYEAFSADRVIAEVNNGGDLVERVIRVVAPTVPYGKVHASRGKITRAEPVAALYEQGRVHHVGCFDALEDEMCVFTPAQIEKRSPNRVDALVWALTALMVDGRVVKVDDSDDDEGEVEITF